MSASRLPLSWRARAALHAGPGDPIDAPADLVWRFRLASLGGLAAAWTVLALVTGTLLSRPARN